MKNRIHAILILLAIVALPSIASTAMTEDSTAAAATATAADTPTTADTAAAPVIAPVIAAVPSAGTRQFSAEAQLPTGEPITATIVGTPSDEGRAKAALSNAISRAQQFFGEFFSTGGVANQLDSLGKGKELELSPTGFEFISRAVTLGKQTDGFFDIAGPSPKHLFMKSDSRRISLNSEKRTISFKSDDMKLDLGRIALGYACDLMMETISADGFANASVSTGPVTRNIGRDIYTPWDVVVGFGETTSTGAHRAYRYGVSNVATATVSPDGIGRGLIDPLNKKEVAVADGLRSVTVIASNAMNATAFALAAYTVGPEYAMKYVMGHTSIRGIIVDGQGNLVASKNMIVEGVPYEKRMNEQTASDGGPNDQKQRELEEKSE